MRLLQWVKRAIQFVFDPEMYFLALLALRNHLKKRHPETVALDEKKRATSTTSR